MPKYQYIAKTRDARQIREIEDAAGKDDLLHKLRSRGLFVISVAEVKQTAAQAEQAHRAKRNSIKLFDLTFLARNLATTLSSGVTLLRSLEILSSQTESGGLEKILRQCIERIKGGLSFSEAIRKYPTVFNNLWRGIIEIGEASGNLPMVLERLADYMEMRMDFERKVKGAMVYPAVIMIVAVLAMLAFFKFILPKFIDIFDSFKVKLPAPTAFMFGVSQFLEKYLILLIGGAVAAIAGISYLMKQPPIRRLWDKISLKLPILGPLNTFTSLEAFTSTMYILLESGLPLVYTLEVASRSIGNVIMEETLLNVKDRVKEGVPLSDELRKTGVFPNLIAEMAKIGEETGNMPEVFKKISTYYQKEASAQVDAMLVAFEPLTIVFMGLLIGGMVIALFLPLFKLGSMGTNG